MTTDLDISALLRRGIEKHFGFLFAQGFHFLDGEAEDGPVLVSLALAATQVAIIVYFDRREPDVQLDVAKVSNGRITHRGQGGYYDYLSAYLRRFCGFRGSVLGSMTPEKSRSLSLWEWIERDIGAYARILQTHAPRIIDDTEDFQVPPG